MKNFSKRITIILFLLNSFQIHAQNEINWMQFSKDSYVPGTFDDQGNYLNGTELMRLTSYKNKLFAGTSMFKDSFAIAPYTEYNGCQVLRKDSSNAPWRVDVSFGTRYYRTDALENILFTHDSLGNPLPQPVEMLVAGIWDLGVGVPKQRNISVAIRDDNTGNWFISDIISVPPSESGFVSVRSMAMHHDYVTGAQYLYVGAAYGGMFKGVYDPGVPGKIRWDNTDELDSLFGRPHSMTVCYDTLYASFDYGGLTVTGQTGGLFKRIDGASPYWQQVYSFYNPSYPTWNQTLRGITTVPSLTNPSEFDIVGAIESIPLPVVIQFQPYNNYQVVNEENYVDYFTTVFGAAPQYDNNLGAAALNKLEPFLNPYNSESGYLITTNLMHPNNPAVGYNGAYFMYRKNDGTFDWGYVQPDSSLTNGKHLRGIRTIEKSPFSDEPGVYYFGGFPAGTFYVKNTAWIYKGTIQNPIGIAEQNFQKKILIYPNPTNTILFIKTENNNSLQYQITNFIGQVLQHEKVAGQSINVSNLPNGIYIISFTNNKNEASHFKFIKQ